MTTHLLSWRENRIYRTKFLQTKEEAFLFIAKLLAESLNKENAVDSDVLNFIKFGEIEKACELVNSKRIGFPIGSFRLSDHESIVIGNNV